MNINIQILFFGKLKSVWNKHDFTYATSAKNIEELYQELLNKAESTPHKESIKVAINDEFVNWDSSINEGDIIAFLPPASGG